MVAKKKILAISGIRSDYDLMSALYRRLAVDEQVDFRLLVGGAHLSKTYGYTVDLIRRDGIPILGCIESLIDADSRSSRIKSASVLLTGAIDLVAGWMPDLILYAGDREEVWIGALLGTYLDIPTVHFYGGDHTGTGHVDNPVRHAVSKLATAHMVTIDEHRQRLIAMGEDPRRIFVVGNLSLDNFVGEPIVPAHDVARAVGAGKLPESYALVLFHPDPSEIQLAPTHIGNIVAALQAEGIVPLLGYPNTDPGNRAVIDVINDSAARGAIVYRNLDRPTFISLYRGARFIIGNSSSGIMEAASIPLPAINVGIRQRGRTAAGNVEFCDGDQLAITAAVRRAMDPARRVALAGIRNPYGDGKSAERACNLLLQTDFAAIRLKTEDPLDVQTAIRSAP